MDPNTNNPNNASEPITWPQTGLRTALVAALFSVVVLALLLFNHFQGKQSDPLNSKELAQLKTALIRDPLNESLKTQIRTLDLNLRKAHARHVAIAEYGSWLLIGGAVLFLITYKPATRRRKLPRPQKRSAAEYARELTHTRVAIGVFAVGIGGATWLISANSTTELVGKSQAVAKATNTVPAAIATTTTAAPFPSPEELKRNWPRFRGPGGLGFSPYTNAPLTWDVKTGQGILWKVAAPVGPSSPVLWDDRLFLTTATATKREVYCYDAGSGKLLWQKPVDPARTNNEPPTVMEDTGGYGPSTPCTDGRRIYAMYANGDVAAFDFNGNLAWARNLGLPENGYGHATSLEMYHDRLLVQLDQATPKDNRSKLLALDGATGKTVWETEPRPVPASWATPIVINAGAHDQIITCANPWVIAYTPAEGKEVWRAKALYGEVLPSPIFAAGLIFTAMEGDKLSAIKPDGSGDVTATHIAWTATDGLPDVVSPVSDGERLYLASSTGTVTAYEAKTGKKLWEKETELIFQASPTCVGNRLYFICDKGNVLVLQTGTEYKELARIELGEKVLASPAFANGRIFIRTQDHLLCVGQKGN